MFPVSGDLSACPTVPPLQNVYSCRQLREATTRRWHDLVRSKRATVETLRTFQGRHRHLDSTNGCTVIAPLVGYRHIKWAAARLPSSHIEHVIDTDCPPILAEIRKRYGLAPGAFCVPADVHDYLFQRKLLEVCSCVRR